MTYLPGINGSAAYFNGSTSITLGQASNFGIVQHSFTVSAWILPHYPSPNYTSWDNAGMGTNDTITQKGLQILLRNAVPYFGFYK